MTDFERCLAFVKAHEVDPHTTDGWVNQLDDHGGRTRWGLSGKAHPEIDLTALRTWDDAVPIYRKLYWEPIHGDALGWPLCLVVFDWAVNSGVGAVLKNLQGEPLWRGNSTQLHSLLDLRRNYRVQQAKQPGQGQFLAGWLNRILDVALECL